MLPASESVGSKMERAQSLLTFPRQYVALALLQAAHSAEEYFTRFYERIREGSSLLHEVIPVGSILPWRVDGAFPDCSERAFAETNMDTQCPGPQRSGRTLVKNPCAWVGKRKPRDK